MMSIEQVGLQLGITGLVVIVVYRTALVFIARWAVVEDRRTQSLEAGLTSIATEARGIANEVKVNAIADTEAHGEIAQRIARIESKLDTVRVRAKTSPRGYPNSGDDHE